MSEYDWGMHIGIAFARFLLWCGIVWSSAEMMVLRYRQ